MKLVHWPLECRTFPPRTYSPGHFTCRAISLSTYDIPPAVKATTWKAAALTHTLDPNHLTTLGPDPNRLTTWDSVLSPNSNELMGRGNVWKLTLPLTPSAINFLLVNGRSLYIVHWRIAGSDGGGRRRKCSTPCKKGRRNCLIGGNVQGNMSGGICPVEMSGSRSLMGGLLHSV